MLSIPANEAAGVVLDAQSGTNTYRQAFEYAAIGTWDGAGQLKARATSGSKAGIGLYPTNTGSGWSINAGMTDFTLWGPFGNYAYYFNANTRTLSIYSNLTVLGSATFAQTVTGNGSGWTNIPASSITNLGTAALSNATAFALSSVTNVTLAGQSNLLRTSFADIGVTNVTQAGQSNLLRTSFADISVSNNVTNWLSWVQGGTIDAGPIPLAGGRKLAGAYATGYYYTGAGAKGFKTNVVTFLLAVTNNATTDYVIDITEHTAGGASTTNVQLLATKGPGAVGTNIVAVSVTNGSASAFTSDIISYRFQNATACTNWLIGGYSVFIR
jgi:hypothetical protein